MANKIDVVINFAGKTKELEDGLKAIKDNFKNIQISDTVGSDLRKKIEQATEALDHFKRLAGKERGDQKDVAELNKAYDKLSKLIDGVNSSYEKLTKSGNKTLLSKQDLDNYKKLEDYWNKVTEAQKESANKLKEYNKQFKELEKQLQKTENERKTKQAEFDTNELGRASAIKDARAALKRPKVNEEKLIGEAQNRYAYLMTKGEGKFSNLNKEDREQAKGLKALVNLINDQARLTEEIKKSDAEAKKLQKSLEGLERPVFDSNNEAVQQFREELGKITKLDPEKLYSVEELGEIFRKLPDEKVKEIRTQLSGLGIDIEKLIPGLNEAKTGVDNVNTSTDELLEKNKEIQQLTDRFKQFFSITSGFYLLRRAVRSAYTAVQELDAVMTETAVVTDFTVGDMWKQLPQYTKVANELGVATKDVYESATLYYQQGLDQQQVEQLNIATLKLARIASLDAAEATDRMTNALRGFNMELNETNANRIADVYSKLAAITAADVDEISTAMTKTASIASSAGMQFETTAAFLSQIIETTRESAETAGTAMKTVIARFQELKKAPDEIGEVDGEIVDANKVEGALRTVGISLRDASGQFRELDEVFLELSSKWNSLDKNTQRYIATIAAGSRQQSRFIAMMQNYNHTMELVNAANNAAGASQQQYEKTLESLESKLARLKNAWNEFVLTLVNSDLIKGTVDLLNNLLTAINKLTGDSGLAKLGVAIAGFTGTRNLIKNFGKVTTNFLKKLSFGPTDKHGLLGLIDGTLNSQLTAMNVSLKEGAPLLQKYFTIKANAPNFSESLKNINGVNISLKEGIISLLKWGGAIAAITASLYILYRVWKDNTPEEKLKKQIQLTTDLEKETERVKATLDELEDAEISLGEQYQNLDKLTEGTEKWNSALAETNEKVLDLLEKFPALAGAISNNNGLLKIDFNSDAYKNFIEQQKKQVIFDQVGTSSSRIGEVERREEIALREAIRKTGFNEENVVQIARLVAEGTVRIDGEGGLTGIEKLEQIGEGLTGWSNWQQKIIENIDVLRDFGQTLHADEIQIEAHKEAVKDDLISGFEEADQKILDAVDDFINYSDGIDKDIEKQYTKYMSNGLTKIDKHALSKAFAEAQYGTGSTVNFRGQIHSANGEYKGMIPEVEEMLRALSREKNIKNYTENIEKLNEDLKSEEVRKRLGDLREILTGEKISREKLPNIQELTDSYIESIYNSLNNAYPGLFGDFKNFLSKVRSRIDEEASVVAKVTEGEERYGKFNSDISSKVLEGIFDNLDKVRISQGADAAQKLADTIKTTTDEAFLAELNKVDWSDRAQLEGLITTIEDLGIAADGVNVNYLVKQIIELNHATTNLSLEQLTEKITEFASSIENVKGKVEDGVKTFSKSEYESLISAGANASDFVRTGADQYTYGGETVDLLSTINGNLVTLVNDYNKNLQERIAQGARIDSLSDADKANLLALNTGDSQALKGKIEQAGKSYVEYLKEIGEKIGLKVAGLGEDELEKALGQAYENYGLGGITYRQNQNTYEGQFRSSRELLYSEQNGQGMLNLYSQIGDEKALAAVQTAIIQEKQLDVAYKNVSKSLASQNSILQKNDNLVRAHVIDIHKNVEAVKRYGEIVADNKEVLESENKDSLEYAQSLQALRDGFKEITGVELSPEELETYKTELIQLGEGGKTAEVAFKTLSDHILESFIEKLELSTEEGKKLDNIIDEINSQNVEIGGTADFTNIFSELTALGLTINEAAKLIEGLGFTLNFQWETGWSSDGKNIIEGLNGIDPGILEAEGLKQIRILKGAVVTRKDFTNSNNITSKGSGKGSSSKKENDNKWENPYNILYNHIEHVNELLRERNKIEFEYNKLIRDNSDAVKVEAGLYKEVLANLEEQRKEQQYIYNQAKEGYREQLKDIPYDKYLEEIEDAAVKAAGKTRIQQLAGYDFEKNQVYIDWSGIADYEQELKAGGLSDDEAKILNALTSVTDYLKDTESNMDAAEDALMEIENTIYDIQQNLREAYIEFEDRVITAIENIRQQEIDNQKQTNEALDSAASDLLNSIRSNIDKMRQDRANENTEEELARKERRLAYLRMDTSGSHNTEIAKLEKELRESQLDYADTLVDQSLQEMQDQNDAAAEQRERQITLMEDQLEWDKENGIIARQASQLIEDSKNLGYVTEDSALYKILYDGEGWASKSKAALDQILQDTNKQFAKAIAALNELLVPANYGDYSAEIDRQIAKYNQATTEEEKAALLATIERLNILRNKKIDDTESEYAKQNSRELIDSILNGTYDPNQWNEKAVTKTERVEYLPAANRPLLNESNATDDRIDEEKDIVRRIMSSGRRIAEKGVESYNDFGKGDYVVTNGGIYQITGGSNGNFTSELVAAITKKQFKELGGDYRYASGGLADFTGPAWLDGTPSKPEVVLNARDSENLIQLRDILRNNQNSGTNIGDSYFDIDINVDEIAGDYDVDRMVDKIKQIIYNDSTRNQVYIPR